MRLISTKIGVDEEKVFELISENLNDISTCKELQIKKIREKISRYYHEFRVIIDIKRKNICGYITTYDYRQIDGNCRLELYLKNGDFSPNDIYKLLRNYITDIFCEYSIHTIYYEGIYEVAKLKVLEKVGFIKCGQLKEYIYLNGKYHDQQIYYITEELIND